jgi:1-phosphofructokinase
MIVTLTANPSLDRTVTLSDALRVGEVQSALSVREDAGGKGINVTRVLAGSGVATRAVLPLDADDPFAAVLRSAHVPVLAVPLPGVARANLTLTDREGVDHQDQPSGCDAHRRGCGDAHRRDRARVGRRRLARAGRVASAGPAEDFYVDVIAAVRAAGASAPARGRHVGAALRAVVERGTPDLIKPNDEELVELAGVALDAELPLPEAVLAVARELVPPASVPPSSRSAATAPCSSTPTAPGSAPSAHARAQHRRRGRQLAGRLLLADVAGAAPDERVRSGIRYGSAAAALPGTQAPTPTDLLPGDVPVRSLALKTHPEPKRPLEVTVSEIITPALVSLDESLGTDKRAVIDALAARVAAAGRATDAAALAADAWKREQTDETGLPGGIAIPHAKSAAVREATLAFARLKPGVDFGADDGPADLVFLIAAPDTAAEEHLAVLSQLARASCARTSPPGCAPPRPRSVVAS